jgi:thiol-disulfide isomerase/thioredoxin
MTSRGNRWSILAAALLTLAAKKSAAPEVALLKGPEALPPLIAQLSEGGHPVVLHFFATWCGPCRAEMPLIRKVLARAQTGGANVALISLDQPADRLTKVPEFLRKNGIDAPAYVLDAPESDPVTALLDPAWTGSIPATFVLRKGKRTESFLEPLTRIDELDRALNPAGEK